MEQGEADVDVEVEQPHQHHKTGHHWLDKVLPISALFVSFVSIGIAYHHGEVMQDLVGQNERLVQANSLPQLVFSLEMQKADGKSFVRHTVENKGVGPADIRFAEIKLDGVPVKDVSGLLSRCCASPDAVSVRSANIQNTVLRPAEALVFAEVNEVGSKSESVEKLMAASAKERIVTTICYCSVFDECWTKTSMSGHRPRPVNACPIQQAPPPPPRL